MPSPIEIHRIHLIELNVFAERERPMDAFAQWEEYPRPILVLNAPDTDKAIELAKLSVLGVRVHFKDNAACGPYGKLPIGHIQLRNARELHKLPLKMTDYHLLIVPENVPHSPDVLEEEQNEVPV